MYKKVVNIMAEIKANSAEQLRNQLDVATRGVRKVI